MTSKNSIGKNNATEPENALTIASLQKENNTLNASLEEARRAQTAAEDAKAKAEAEAARALADKEFVTTAAQHKDALIAELQADVELLRAELVAATNSEARTEPTENTCEALLQVRPKRDRIDQQGKDAFLKGGASH